MPEQHAEEGRWRLRTAPGVDAEQALALARDRRVALAETNGPAELGAVAAWFKHDHLRGKTRVRYALKRAVGQALPRFAEFANLEWLRARAFLAPRPLAAGALFVRALPVYQFLVTERVSGVATLAEFLRARADPLRADVLEELAREVARMHALRFVHRDLYARNVLVERGSERGRVWFLDCWAGGPPPGLRGSEYDLACFLADTRAALDDSERARFVADYEDERRAQERPRRRRS